MQKVEPTALLTVAVASATSVALARWLKDRFPPSNCHLRGHTVSLHDTILLSTIGNAVPKKLTSYDDSQIGQHYVML